MRQLHHIKLIGRSLHWVVALGFITLSLLGIYMVNAEAWNIYPSHKSLGVLLLSVIVFRIGWRLWFGCVGSALFGNIITRRLANVVHGLLLAGTLLMPLSGISYSGWSGHGVALFGWKLVAMHLDAAGQVVPYSVFWSDLSEQVHEVAGYSLLLLLLGHIAAAVKHRMTNLRAPSAVMAMQTPQDPAGSATTD